MICSDCNHEHAGVDLAFICARCPCSSRPCHVKGCPFTSPHRHHDEAEHLAREWIQQQIAPFEPPNRLHVESLALKFRSILRDRDTMAETLTIAQERGTELVEEVRLLKARLARYGA